MTPRKSSTNLPLSSNFTTRTISVTSRWVCHTLTQNSWTAWLCMNKLLKRMELTLNCKVSAVRSLATTCPTSRLPSSKIRPNSVYKDSTLPSNSTSGWPSCFQAKRAKASHLIALTRINKDKKELSSLWADSTQGKPGHHISWMSSCIILSISPVQSAITCSKTLSSSAFPWSTSMESFLVILDATWPEWISTETGRPHRAFYIHKYSR